MQQPNAMATHTVGVAPPLSLAMEGLTPRHKSIENSLRAVLLVRRAAGAPVFHGSRACPPQVVDDISKGPMYAAHCAALMLLLLLLRHGVPLTRGGVRRCSLWRVVWRVAGWCIGTRLRRRHCRLQTSQATPMSSSCACLFRNRPCVESRWKSKSTAPRSSATLWLCRQARLPKFASSTSCSCWT